MKRWLLLPLVLGIAAFAGYALLSAPAHVAAGPNDARDPREVERPKQARSKERLPDEPTVAPVPVEQPEIREASRERLLEILREADREGR